MWWWKKIKQKNEDEDRVSNEKESRSWTRREKDIKGAEKDNRVRR